MEVAVASDTGKVREINEDSYCVLINDGKALLAVADGMGGHNAGEVASKIAVDTVANYFQRGEYSLSAIVEAFAAANEAISKEARQRTDCDGMGTTLTVGIINGQRLYIGHIGDTRLYLIRNRSIRQLTEDHSLVGELVRLGKITLEEAESHPQRNIITRALGTEAKVIVDTHEEPLRQNDIIVLCTDGLSNLVTATEILDYLLMADDLQTGADLLLHLANARGGTDNITLAVVRILADDHETE